MYNIFIICRYTYYYIYKYYYINFKAINNVLDAKMVLKTHLFIKIFHLLYRGFVSLMTKTYTAINTN